MDISSLNAFITVARYKSFSKASNHLFITQPAVSKRVAALEAELGVVLFNRIARTVSLTEAGKQLLSKAHELVDQAEELQRYASNLNQDISGNLAVSISHHIGLYRMPPILKTFNERHSEVDLDIRFEDSDQAFSSVEKGDIEFAVITLPKVLPEKISAEVVWVDDLFIVASKEHDLSKIAKVTLPDLAKHSCVLPSKETETHQIMQRLFESNGIDMKLQMQTNSLQTLKMLVQAGIGWSLLPKSMLEDGELRVLDVGLNLRRSLGLVFHTKRSLSNAAVALSTLIKSDGALSVQV
ncbi:LysR family transcriptional regulator [Arenicella sp. 4NH20-0111]|uniref:LysR family transcriptional regulator n=1 Tax=Arenicella sp. 4NH20-0111 TaxID=3127648 RepID=UPI00310B4375